MAEAMRQTVASLLQGIERYVINHFIIPILNVFIRRNFINNCVNIKLLSTRYNPQHLSTLEHYVEVQSQENTYDLEANLAVLKIYQFHHDYNLDITVKIMLKAITNFPHSDFVLCKCLLNEKLVSNGLLK